MRTIASQKMGMLMPASAKTEVVLSSHEYCLTAEITPTGTPTTMATSIAAIVSSSVAGNRVEQLGGDRPPADYGVAQVSSQGVGEEDPVLHDDGLVEPHALPDLLDLLLGRLLPEQQLRRVAGDRPHHEEHHDGHPEQHGDDLQDPAPDVLSQSLDLLSRKRPAGPYAPPPEKATVLNASPPVGLAW